MILNNIRKTQIWLSIKLLLSKKFFFGGSAPLSIFGLILGVAALIVSQSVMRGFEVTLKKTMIDMTGDIQIVRTGQLVAKWKEFQDQIKAADSEIEKVMKFVYAEAVLAYQGRVSGVLLQGINFNEAKEILSIEKRITAGALPSIEDPHSEIPSIVIGTGLARKFSLKISDQVYLAVPLSTPFESNSFKRQTQQFQISAIADMGKNDWNERLILVDIQSLQKMTEIGDRFTGALVKIKNSDRAQLVSHKISETLGLRFNVTNWYSVNSNLFEAVALEKIVIFCVVFLIVIVAAFNISSTLYVLIRQRFKDIAILRSIGCTQKMIQNIFILQGLIVATLATMIGFILGLFLCYCFMWVQTHFSVISGAVYKVDRIDIHLSIFDFLIIYGATLIACFLAVYSPAKKGSYLNIIEGLKSE